MTCIDWPGVINNKGYGVVRVGKTTTGAHRKAWIDANGPISDGLVIDHLCRNRRCVNVAHMELVTVAENTRRAPRFQVTHCPNGHALEGDNLYVQVRGSSQLRSCRICRREAGRRWGERRKAS